MVRKTMGVQVSQQDGHTTGQGCKVILIMAIHAMAGRSLVGSSIIFNFVKVGSGEVHRRARHPEQSLGIPSHAGNHAHHLGEQWLQSHR